MNNLSVPVPVEPSVTIVIGGGKAREGTTLSGSSPVISVEKRLGHNSRGAQKTPAQKLQQILRIRDSILKITDRGERRKAARYFAFYLQIINKEFPLT